MTRPAARFVLALDQGTTSSRAILFNHLGRVVAAAQRELPQHFPAPGHVEHDPEQIWAGQLATIREAIDQAGIQPGDVAAIGITNQRETTIVWDRATGHPVAPAIVWQSRVTAPRCEALRAAGHQALFRERTGLPLDAYFSGPKIAEILDSQLGLRERAGRGELAFGTVDSFLLWRLTGGRVHATDVSNASRTMLLDIRTGEWDPELCAIVGVPMAVLPEVRPSSGVFGETDPDLLGSAIPITGIAGDQQAATFGQACLAPGQAKNTYGTGAFVLLNTGERRVQSANGLLTTILWRLGADQPLQYALEGSIFVAGAAVQWLRDGLRAITHSAEVERLAALARGDRGLYMVPAFTGLGAPHWDSDARGLIIGITRGTTMDDIARAAVDAIAYQVADVLDAMAADTGVPLDTLRVDGGGSVNDALLQFQADLLGVRVERPVVTETTAMGAAFLAGLAVGFWQGTDEIATTWALDRAFTPSMPAPERGERVAGWRRAVQRSRGWAGTADA